MPTPRDLLPATASPTISPDRGGYTVTMRESFGAEQMLETLAATAPVSSGARLHVGWGSFRNLDIVAARRSGAAILLDINEHQFAVWAAVRQAIVAAEEPVGFIDAVVPLLPTQPPLRQFHTSTSEWLKMELDRAG